MKVMNLDLLMDEPILWFDWLDSEYKDGKMDYAAYYAELGIGYAELVRVGKIQKGDYAPWVIYEAGISGIDMRQHTPDAERVEATLQEAASLDKKRTLVLL